MANRRELLGVRSVAGWLGLATVALGVVCLLPALRADDTSQAASAARLSSVEGQVRVSQGGQVLADPALVNTPLFEGTQIATGDDGKAEIQFGDGSVARLSPNSALTLTALGGQNGTGDAEMLLEGGLGYFELQGAAQGGQLRVRFGDTVATATGFTVLRIKLDSLPGEVSVFNGNAHMERGSSLALDLHGGESVTLNGTDPTQYSLAETIEPDSWDAWNADRDQALTTVAAEQTTTASNFVNSDTPIPAWNDLDANGNWYNVPGQGYIWSPYQASGAGWDPYGCGHWMWTPRFGYVWVSCYSWGFMPYQCGRWNYYDSFGWGWAPGMGGGCGSRWGMGYYGGGGVNIGYGPSGYNQIARPNPRHPFGRNPQSVIGVTRRTPGGGGGLPTRDRNTPVIIAGHSVEPLRPVTSRPGYQRPGSGFVSRTDPANSGTRPTGTQPGPGRPSYSNGGGGNRSVFTPSPSPGYSGGQSEARPSRSYSGGSYSGSSQPRSASGSGSAGGSSQPRYSPSGGSSSGSSQPRYSGGGGSSSGGGSTHSGGSYSGGGGGYSGGASSSHSSGGGGGYSGGSSGGGGGGGSHTSGGGGGGSNNSGGGNHR